MSKRKSARQTFAAQAAASQLTNTNSANSDSHADSHSHDVSKSANQLLQLSNSSSPILSPSGAASVDADALSAMTNAHSISARPPLSNTRRNSAQPKQQVNLTPPRQLPISLHIDFSLPPFPFLNQQYLVRVSLLDTLTKQPVLERRCTGIRVTCHTSPDANDAGIKELLRVTPEPLLRIDPSTGSGRCELRFLACNTQHANKPFRLRFTPVYMPETEADGDSDAKSQPQAQQGDTPMTDADTAQQQQQKLEAAIDEIGTFTSHSYTVCRHSLIAGPVDNIFYKDEGGKDRVIACKVALCDAQQHAILHRDVPLKLTLVYESPELHQKQSEREAKIHSGQPQSSSIVNGSLMPLAISHYTVVPSQTVMRLHNELIQAKIDPNNATHLLRFRLEEVSRNHNGRAFCLLIAPDTHHAANKAYGDIAPCITNAITVLSKRNKRRGRKQMGVNTPTMNGTQQLLQDSLLTHRRLESGDTSEVGTTYSHSTNRRSTVLVQPSAINATILAPDGSPIDLTSQSPAVASNSYNQIDRLVETVIAPSRPPLRSAPRLDPCALPVVHESLTSWSMCAHMALSAIEWKHVGFEVNSDASLNLYAPLFRCPHCNRYKDALHPPEHAADCMLALSLTMYEQEINSRLQQLHCLSKRNSKLQVPESFRPLSLAQYEKQQQHIVAKAVRHYKSASSTTRDESPSSRAYKRRKVQRNTKPRQRRRRRDEFEGDTTNSDSPQDSSEESQGDDDDSMQQQDEEENSEQPDNSELELSSPQYPSRPPAAAHTNNSQYRSTGAPSSAVASHSVAPSNNVPSSSSLLSHRLVQTGSTGSNGMPPISSLPSAASALGLTPANGSTAISASATSSWQMPPSSLVSDPSGLMRFDSAFSINDSSQQMYALQMQNRLALTSLPSTANAGSPFIAHQQALQQLQQQQQAQQQQQQHSIDAHSMSSTAIVSAAMNAVQNGQNSSRSGAALNSNLTGSGVLQPASSVTLPPLSSELSFGLSNLQSLNADILAAAALEQQTTPHQSTEQQIDAVFVERCNLGLPAFDQTDNVLGFYSRSDVAPHAVQFVPLHSMPNSSELDATVQQVRQKFGLAKAQLVRLAQAAERNPTIKAHDPIRHLAERIQCRKGRPLSEFRNAVFQVQPEDSAQTLNASGSSSGNNAAPANTNRTPSSASQHETAPQQNAA